MPAGTVRLPVAGFWADNSDVVTAALSILLALLVATVLDRYLARRGHRLAEAVTRGQVSAVLDTRLRFIRRLLYATILLVGAAVALSQFAGLSKLATSVLASGVIAAAIIGFAARQTLANAIAGILLAITQPIRLGDLVTFQEETGEVEDIRLTYTYLRLDDGRRLVIPNEQLAQSPLVNHTVVDPRVQVGVDVWLAPGADASRALELLGEEEGVEASVAEVTADGVRVRATTWAESPRERGGVASGLRARSLHRLREDGLSSEQPARPGVS